MQRNQIDARRARIDARDRFTENMALIMREKRFRQVDIARDLQVDPSRVNHWLHGHTFPSPESMDDIAECLGVDVSRFLANPARRRK